MDDKDFNFDNLGDFDSGIDENDIGELDQASSNDFSGFDSNPSSDEGAVADKKAVIKTAIITAIVGLVIIVITFLVMKMIYNKSKNAKIAKNKQNITEKANNQKESGYNNNEAVDKTQNQTKQTDTSEWKTFTATKNIVFNDDYFITTFTVKDVKNYVKIVDSENNLVVKTIVRGTLKGLKGIYEIELPYYKGSQLKIGNSFNVDVQLGNFKGKDVVGEIKY